MGMRYTFDQFKAEYPDDGACLDEIMKQQYGGMAFDCPGCGVASKFHRIAKRRAYACQRCGHHIYPCVGTVFEKSRTPLHLWFFAMYLFTTTRHGVAAKELERQLGVTYKCAWRMAHELRKLMAAADLGDRDGKMAGHVEVDETFIGGKQRAGDRRKRGSNKTVVMGIVERDGKLRAGPIGDTSAMNLLGIIENNVEPGSTVTTDEYRGYRDLTKMGYQHGTVNHSAEEWVNGAHHTNTIEGHWSQLKRSIRGTHIQVSAKHLWKYVAEFSYRRNTRNCHRTMFGQLVSAFSLPRLQDA
jgi:transposase